MDGSGLVDFNEFAFSLMGEKAIKYGTLADMEVLSGMLTDTAALLQGLKDSLGESKEANEERATRNAELRSRMKQMKKDFDGNLGSVVGQMMSMMGQDPLDIMTDEEVIKVLTETFKKFDNDKAHLRYDLGLSVFGNFDNNASLED